MGTKTGTTFDGLDGFSIKGEDDSASHYFEIKSPQATAQGLFGILNPKITGHAPDLPFSVLGLEIGSGAGVEY